MLKRFLYLLASCWALVFLGNALTKESGPRPLDIVLALAPFIATLLFVLAARFVVTGSPLRPLATVTIEIAGAQPRNPQLSKCASPQSSPQLYLLPKR